MPVVFGGLTPHPPLLIPQIGKEAIKEVFASLKGLELFSKRLVASSPELLLLVTPHGPVFREAPSIFTIKSFSGDFRQFGAPEVKLEADNYLPLARRIIDEAANSGFPLIELDEISIYRSRLRPFLDHATMVPLFYFQKAGLSVPMVLISIGMTPYKELFLFGKMVLSCVLAEGKRTALVASGDLSHRLIPSAPAGYDPIGKEFDRLILELLASGNFRGILSINEDLIERAGECGFRPLTITAGAWEELSLNTSVLSYEGPFGVGYGVVLCEPKEIADQQGSVGNKEQEPQKNEQEPQEPENREIYNSTWLLDLIKKSVEKFVTNGNVITVPKDIPSRFASPGGVFVSLRKHGQLRGCIGSLEPTTESIAKEVIQMAISAATRDPRFPAVKKEELIYVEYSVDLLSPLEPVTTIEELDPKKYGVVVKSDEKRGVLLPDLPGVDTVIQQVNIAKEKAGINASADVKLYRFNVTRYGKK